MNIFFEFCVTQILELLKVFFFYCPILIMLSTYFFKKMVFILKRIMSKFNPNQTGGLKKLPRYILLYNFSTTSPNLRNLVTFPKIYLGLIFWNFFSIFKLVFAVSALFHDQLLFFCMCSVGKMNTCLTLIVPFKSRSFRKIFFDFFNNTFPIETGVINLFH